MPHNRSEDALTESAIDREIERALAVEPSPEFMARVRRRIANEPTPTAWRAPWVVLAIGAMAGVMVVVIAVSRPAQKPSPSSANAPLPGKPVGDVLRAPAPAIGPPEKSAAAAPPLRGSRAVPESNGAARSRSAASPTRSEVSADEAVSGGAGPTEVVRIPLSGVVRVGGDVKAPRKIVDVKPLYPDNARAGRATGLVVLDVTIAIDGSVSNTRVLRSSPLFDQAAIDAVTQWKFEPTVLNGAPVEVEMVVYINFGPPSE